MYKSMMVVALALVMAVARVGAAEQEILTHFYKVTRTVPFPGESVLRFELDVTGDGKPELFLGSGRGSLLWVVYTPTGEGQYRQLGTIKFSDELFRMSQVEVNGVVEWHLVTWQPDEQNRGYGRRFEYRIGSSGFELISTGDAIGAQSAEMAKIDAEFREWRKTAQVRILSADAADLLLVDRTIGARKPQKWYDVTTGELASVAPVQGVVIGP
jgi:hypothetical protein